MWRNSFYFLFSAFVLFISPPCFCRIQTIEPHTWTRENNGTYNREGEASSSSCKILLNLELMNFLWSLVSCYCGAASGGGETGARRRPMEEAAGSGSPLRQRKRARTGQGEWRPTLCSIMEDSVVLAAERVRGGEKKAASKPGPVQVGRRSSSGSRARVHVRGHSDDYG